MPESIFQLVGLIPMSGIQLVQKYKRATNEVARQLVAHQGANNDDDSFVSHLCVYPMQPDADPSDTDSALQQRYRYRDRHPSK
jgi:hypothetical protein